jgi:hypothetical protein
MRQGRLTPGGTAAAAIVFMLAASSAATQTQDIRFCWDPPPETDEFGNPYAEPVTYRVYCRVNGGSLTLVATVAEPTYVLNAEPDCLYRVCVSAVSAAGLEGPLSYYSDAVETGAETVPVQGVTAPPAAVQLKPPYPNPFNPSTVLSYGVPAGERAAGSLSLTVFDLRGCRVRAFRGLDGTVGWHSVVWDGRDDRGRELESGLYVVYFRCGSIVRAAKATLLK